jgi:hypothetical protein
MATARVRLILRPISLTGKAFFVSLKYDANFRAVYVKTPRVARRARAKRICFNIRLRLVLMLK